MTACYRQRIAYANANTRLIAAISPGGACRRIGEQQRPYQPPCGRHQPRASGNFRRPIHLEEHVAQPQCQDPVRSDLVADYHSWPGETPVCCGSQGLPAEAR